MLVQTELNLVNLLERALETLTQSRPQAAGAEKGTQLPASQSDAEELMGSTLLLILAVSCSSHVCACLLQAPHTEQCKPCSQAFTPLQRADSCMLCQSGMDSYNMPGHALIHLVKHRVKSNGISKCRTVYKIHSSLDACTKNEASHELDPWLRWLSEL